MSVYIDPLFTVTPEQVRDPQARRLTAKYGQWSHLHADSDAELLAFGKRLGMRVEWVQYLGTAKAHFDLVPPRRAKALVLGAIEITAKDRLLLVMLKALALSKTGSTTIDFRQHIETKPAQPTLI